MSSSYLELLDYHDYVSYVWCEYKGKYVPDFANGQNNPYDPRYLWDKGNCTWTFDSNSLYSIQMGDGYTISPGAAGVRYELGQTGDGTWVLSGVDNAAITYDLDTATNVDTPDSIVVVGHFDGNVADVDITVKDSYGNTIGTGLFDVSTNAKGAVVIPLTYYVTDGEDSEDVRTVVNLVEAETVNTLSGGNPVVQMGDVIWFFYQDGVTYDVNVRKELSHKGSWSLEAGVIPRTSSPTRYPRWLYVQPKHLSGDLYIAYQHYGTTSSQLKYAYWDESLGTWTNIAIMVAPTSTSVPSIYAYEITGDIYFCYGNKMRCSLDSYVTEYTLPNQATAIYSRPYIRRIGGELFFFSSNSDTIEKITLGTPGSVSTHGTWDSDGVIIDIQQANDGDPFTIWYYTGADSYATIRKFTVSAAGIGTPTVVVTGTSANQFAGYRSSGFDKNGQLWWIGYSTGASSNRLLSYNQNTSSWTWVEMTYPESYWSGSRVVGGGYNADNHEFNYVFGSTTTYPARYWATDRLGAATILDIGSIEISYPGVEEGSELVIEEIWTANGEQQMPLGSDTINIIDSGGADVPLLIPWLMVD